MAKGRRAVVTGIRGVERALRKQIKEKRKTLRRAVLLAGLRLQRESQELVPVEFGVLKNSAFTRLGVFNEDQFEVRVGYEAWYAIYVHEILDNYHKPPTMAKYLEYPARYLRKELLQIIREETSK